MPWGHEKTGGQFESDVIDSFEASPHAQACPDADLERFAILRKQFEKKIAQIAKKGVVPIGIFAVPQKANSQHMRGIMPFYAVQQAVRHFLGKKKGDKSYKVGLKDNRADIVNFTWTPQPGDLGGFHFKQNWHREQKQWYADFTKKNSEIIKKIEKYFTISFELGVQEKASDYYDIVGGEKPCLYDWYVITLTPKKDIPEEEKVGAAKMYDKFVQLWEEARVAVAPLGVDMGDPRPPAVKEEPVAPKPKKVDRPAVEEIPEVPLEETPIKYEPLRA